MATEYIYNGVSVAMCKTVQFTMGEEYDPSGADAVRNRYSIRVKGFLNTGGTRWAAVPTAVILAEVKAALEAPRRPFVYRISGIVVVSVPTGFDAKIGPKPQDASVTEVNSGIFAVECGVEVFTGGCDACDDRNPVVSLRWSQSESFNAEWYSQLTTRGKLIVRSDMRQCADNFRALATPPVLPDYQRTGASYTLSMDGLELDFEFTDQEAEKLPPYPAIKASGSYSVKIEKGLVRMGTVKVALEGIKGTSRDLLLMRAYSMCYYVLAKDGIQADSKTGRPISVWSGSFSYDMFAPKVSAEITSMMQKVTPKGGIYYSLVPSARDAVVDGTPGIGQGAPGLSPPVRKRLTALLAAAFRDPCACASAGVSLVSSGAGGEASLRSVGPPAYTPPAASISEGTPTDLRADVVVDPDPYDTYHMETSTSFDTGKVQMPGTGVGSDGGKSVVLSRSGPMMQVTLTWVAGRTGVPPTLPAFLTPNPNLVPLYGAVVAKDVVPAPDGTTLTYMFSGYYVYAVLDPSKYGVTPPVAPYLGPAVLGAAAGGATSWMSRLGGGGGAGGGSGGAGGAMPFVTGGVVPDKTPTTPPRYPTIAPPITGVGGVTAPIVGPGFGYLPGPPVYGPGAGGSPGGASGGSTVGQ